MLNALASIINTISRAELSRVGGIALTQTYRTSEKSKPVTSSAEGTDMLQIEDAVIELDRIFHSEADFSTASRCPPAYRSLDELAGD